MTQLAVEINQISNQSINQLSQPWAVTLPKLPKKIAAI